MLEQEMCHTGYTYIHYVHYVYLLRDGIFKNNSTCALATKWPKQSQDAINGFGTDILRSLNFFL